MNSQGVRPQPDTLLQVRLFCWSPLIRTPGIGPGAIDIIR
jgi:hypothetical protein